MTEPVPAQRPDWELPDAERWLLGLELFGMSFGLDRMRALMTQLGSPQRRLRSVHVVGSNGKSSTTRMIAAILASHGMRTGEYLSPHLVSFTERVRIAGQDIAGTNFARAAQRACDAVQAVDAELSGGERVTQFEAVTATGYLALREGRVDVAVVEAGLGGRYDATSVIDSEIQVLTSVGLEHTEWLGSSIAEIAAEKVDVVRPGGTLVTGAGLAPEALAVARAVCEQRGARLVVAPADETAAAGGLPPFQRANFALARAAAGTLLGKLDERAVAHAAAAMTIPGRFEIVGTDPVTIHDGAHNPDGITALVAALREFLNGRRLVCCLSVLDDKDAAAMLRQLSGVCDELVLTTATHPRAVAAHDLLALCKAVGAGPATVVDQPHAAIARARESAGAGGVALATGSLYLLADLRRPVGSEGGSTL